MEKEKLKILVREFAKTTSSTGLAVKVVDPRTWEITPSHFILDKYLTWFTLSNPPKKKTGEEPTKYMLFSFMAVLRGEEILRRVPNFPEHLVHETILLEAANPDDRVFLIIEDSNERRKFFISLKVIRISVDLSKKQKNEDR